MTNVRTARTSTGIQIAYTQTGNGPLGVIFQHGWASVGAHYQALWEHLPKDERTFVTLDLIGHGASPDVPNAHSVESYAAQLLSVADAVGFQRFVTVGHSMGAKFCQYLRISAPNRLIGQVALAPTPAAATPVEGSDAAVQRRASRAGNPDMFSQAFSAITKKAIAPQVKERWVHSASRISKDVLASSIRAYSLFDFAGSLPRAAPPTLVVAGAQDPIYPATSVREATESETPTAIFRTLDCGHDIPNEMPYELALLIDGFLAGLADIADHSR